MEQQRLKYEKMIDEMKRNSLNDREFVAKELQKRIDQLEAELKKLRDQFDQERADLLR